MGREVMLATRNRDAGNIRCTLVAADSDVRLKRADA
jgi:hypothetical protein